MTLISTTMTEQLLGSISYEELKQLCRNANLTLNGFGEFDERIDISHIATIITKSRQPFIDAEQYLKDHLDDYGGPHLSYRYGEFAIVMEYDAPCSTEVIVTAPTIVELVERWKTYQTTKPIPKKKH